MYNKSASSVYSCKSFDFDQKTCTLSWTFVNSSPYVSGSRVNVNAEIDDPQAFSFGEPQTTTTSSTTTTITTSTVVTTIATGGENITSSSSTTTSSTSTSSTTTIETGVTTTISELITCPFECCVDETGFENKACEPGKTCIEHECKSETKWVKMPSYVIYVPVVAVVAFSLVFYYLIKTKKLGLFSKPVIVKDELTELAEKIKDLKNNGYDVSSLEKEYELALKCKMNNLKEMTEFHTEELRKKFNEMTS